MAEYIYSAIHSRMDIKHDQKRYIKMDITCSTVDIIYSKIDISYKKMIEHEVKWP